MAATTLVRDLLWRVSQQLGDVSPQFVRWTERELVNWTNDGQRLIASMVPSSCSRTDTIKLAAGTRQSIDSVLAANIKPGDGSVAADTGGTMLLDVVRNMGADGLTPGRAIRVATREALDASDPDWHTSTDDVITEFVFDPRQPKTFYVCPGVAGAAWAEVSWLVSPAPVPYAAGSLVLDGASTQKLSIDDVFVPVLVEFILTQAYLKFTGAGDEDANRHAVLAQTHAAMFASLLGADAPRKGHNPNFQLLPMTPGVVATEK